LTTIDETPRGRDWLVRFAPLGGLVFALWMLWGFFTSDDYDDTAESVLAYAEAEETNIVAMQILALAAPLLIGVFLAGLLARMRVVDDALRTLAIVGGTLFVAFVAVGLTLWNGPLLDDSLEEAGAETYLALDDAGWILLGTGGVSFGVAIMALSIAALRQGWAPRWVGVVSLVLGALSLLTVMAIGFFAWILWLAGTAIYLLLRPDAPRPAAAVDA
jgi:hypothetical protein